MKKKLTIGIPTYNRENQLRNQLKSIFKQKSSKLIEIIIVDNHSNYNVKKVVNEFNTKNIQLIENPFNIKMTANMVAPFLYCETEWLWLLSDDDETLENSLENILSEIDICPPDTGMIKFSIGRQDSIQKDYTAHSLNEYIDYYYNEKQIRRGELVFISTNVFNINNLKDYLGYAFEYTYTYISFLVPVFYGLDCKKISVKFSSEPIVKYIPPREGNYSYGTVGKGLSTLSHLPLSLTKKYHKKFLDCTMSIPYKYLLIQYYKGDKIEDLQDFKIIYNNIYQYYISFPSKVIVKFFFILMLTTNSKKLTKKLVGLYKKI